MKMNSFFRAAMAAGLTLLAVSCTKDDFTDGETPVTGEEVSVSLDYTVRSMSSGDGIEMSDATTRTIPDGIDDGATIPIKNMFIIQFNGKESDSKMIGAPRFLDATDLSANPLAVPLIQTSGAAYTVFVANIPEGRNYNWNLSTQSTFADVVKRVKNLTKEDDNYVTVGGEKTLLLSAVTNTVVATELNPVFTRNVAKVTLNLTLANEKMVITSVRLRNVPTTITYADAALAVLGISDADNYPTDIAVMDYPAVTTGMPTYGNTEEFSWYVPRNQRGVDGNSTAAKDKTFYAPAYATYFEIVANKTDGNTTSSCVFRVYPGANQTNDYNLSANKHYTISLTVVNDGIDTNDSRVETFRDKDLTEIGKTSNSFIINPAPAGGATLRYSIPISQVNRYWGGTAAGYGNTPANVIGANDTWQVELIWCDTEGLFSNSYDTSNICLIDNNQLGIIGRGTGPDQHFELSVPAGMPEGNFTLGIRKDGEILWSWHFWVTNYNPDTFNKSVITTGRYTYPVPGGQVERYADGSVSPHLWSTKYTNTVMMDRALGATENYFKNMVSANDNGWLHYQFGRKDPFPLNAKATTTTSAPPPGEGSKSLVLTDAKVSMKKAVNTPNVFYYTSNTGGNWNNDSGLDATSITWNDPQSNDASKSIYDPCPPGWRVPANGTWNDFDRALDGNYINVQNSLRDLAWGHGRNIGSVTAPINGLRYWPSATAASATSPVEGTIWYPATGGRYSTSGAPASVGSNGYYWSGTPSSATDGRTLYFSSSSVSPQHSSYRAYGFAVRCVAE